MIYQSKDKSEESLTFPPGTDPGFGVQVIFINNLYYTAQICRDKPTGD